jgi:hypothetical protein
MKKLIFTIALFTSITFAASSQDTTMVEQYCRIVITGRPFTTKVVIDIDFGEERRSSGYTWLKDEMTGKVKKFNSIVDALNYMGAQGWTLVNAFPIGDSPIYHYYFKKLFKKSDAN